MWRRYLLGGIFAVVVTGLVALILWNRLDRITPIEIWEAVPSDAVVFVEALDYTFLSESFLPENRIWIDFVNTSGRIKIDSTIQSIISRVTGIEPLRELLRKEGLSFSLHLVGKDQLVPLFYLSYSDNHSDHDFEQILKALPGNESMVNERKYDAAKLYDISGAPGIFPFKFSFACLNGCAVISPSSMLTEASVRTIQSGQDLTADQGLKQIRKTAGKFVHANVYLQYELLAKLFYPWIQSNRWKDLDWMSFWAGWGELDMDVKGNALVLNGMTQTDPEAGQLLGAFTGQTPVRMELHEMIPSGITSFLHLGISDWEQLFDRFRSLLTQMGEAGVAENERKRISDLYEIDPLADLMTIADDEVVWFSIEGETGSREEEISVIELRSRSEGLGITGRWMERYLQVNAFDMKSVRKVYQLDDQTSFDIYRLPDPFYKGTLPGMLFNSYFTVYENYLIFGPSVEVISRVIYQNVLQKTFANDPVYDEMDDYFSNRSSLTFFFRPFSYTEYRSELFSPEAGEVLGQMELFLRRIPGVVIQYSAEQELFYQNLSWKYNAQIKEKALTVWESLLDSVAVMKPALVENHNTSGKEIFVQDAANWIYLINSSGRVLWKQKLEGRILGEVFQVDYYKNGKLQYLFNTRTRLHLIDRNGNYVERYPITLRSPATNAVALVDYDNSRNYRLFVAGEDRQVYLYDLEGDIVTGWRFGKSETQVTGSIQHFRIGERDYIVFSDRNRTYLLNRRGRERIRPETRISLSPQNPLTLDMNIREDRPRWISTDTAGNVLALYEDGSVNTLFQQEVSPEHFFLMRDMDKDGIPEFIFADGNELTVVRQDGQEMFRYRVREKISSMPDIYKFSASDIKIGITDRSRNRIYLINADGSLYEGFPLEGSTRFSIGYFSGSQSRFNLIVGSGNNFLYNYSIQ